MKTDEIIQRVQSLYSKGVQSDDSRLSSRHIYSKLITVRSKLLSQQAQKRQKISQWVHQTIPCIEMIKAPIHECPCLPPLGCEIYRTKYPLPEPLTDLNRHLFESVTTVTGDVIYSEIGWIEKKYKSFNKYTSAKPDFFIRNKHLYITQKRGAAVISVTAVFEDPWDATTYPSLCEKTFICDSPLDMEFPFDNDKIDTLIEMTKIELVDNFNQRIEDKSNNSSDTQLEQSK